MLIKLLFHERLSILRSGRKLSQLEISKRLGIARTTYSGYENGTREPDIETMIKIADFFSVTLDYLIGRTDDPAMWFRDENEKTIYDVMSLNDDEKLSQISMTYDGLELTLEEKKEFLAIAKAIFDVRRSSKKGN